MTGGAAAMTGGRGTSDCMATRVERVKTSEQRGIGQIDQRNFGDAQVPLAIGAVHGHVTDMLQPILVCLLPEELSTADSLEFKHNVSGAT